MSLGRDFMIILNVKVFLILIMSIIKLSFSYLGVDNSADNLHQCPIRNRTKKEIVLLT